MPVVDRSLEEVTYSCLPSHSISNFSPLRRSVKLESNIGIDPSSQQQPAKLAFKGAAKHKFYAQQNAHPGGPVQRE